MLSTPPDVIYRRININSINFVHLGRLLRNSNAAINDIKLDGSNLVLRNNFSQFTKREASLRWNSVLDLERGPKRTAYQVLQRILARVRMN
jgi:hypothetical protein